jgi:TetR/AcrR family transcriptional repressor of lmrAB and yxaGH operons
MPAGPPSDQNRRGACSRCQAEALKLLRQQGYRGTALNDILDAGGSPRGSLYFHFAKGKDEISEAALALAAEGVRQAVARAAET